MLLLFPSDFQQYDFYDTIGSILSRPEDADNINTFFFFTDFEPGARERCEADCDGVWCIALIQLIH